MPPPNPVSAAFYVRASTNLAHSALDSNFLDRDWKLYILWLNTTRLCRGETVVDNFVLFATLCINGETTPSHTCLSKMLLQVGCPVRPNGADNAQRSHTAWVWANCATCCLCRLGLGAGMEMIESERQRSGGKKDDRSVLAKWVICYNFDRFGSVLSSGIGLGWLLW